MGLLDKLTGTRRPTNGTAPRPAAEVHAGLLGLGGPDVPYVVRDGRAEGADLVAEWRILDPAWRTFFVRTQVSSVFRVRMRLVPEKHAVRALDEQYDVTWAGETPSLALSAEARRGQVRTVSTRRTLGGADGHADDGSDGTFRFDSADLKTPLQETVLAAGWTWRGVVSGRL
ncbi:hypothetical protein [Streptomyces sp. Da 82-17]|uniref:hypothetical protein n=1 Tax=Streptomyces sp. Da 82-17 TaxID=3377116 RepID=UPI0038D4A792